MKLKVVIRGENEIRTELLNTDHITSATYIDKGVSSYLILDILNRPTYLKLEGFYAYETFGAMQGEYDKVISINDSRQP